MNEKYSKIENFYFLILLAAPSTGKKCFWKNYIIFFSVSISRWLPVAKRKVYLQDKQAESEVSI